MKAIIHLQDDYMQPIEIKDYRKMKDVCDFAVAIYDSKDKLAAIINKRDFSYMVIIDSE